MKNNWIKCIDKVPENKGIYLVYGKQLGVDIAYYHIYKNGNGSFCQHGESYDCSLITHWMNIEEPEEVDNEYS